MLPLCQGTSFGGNECSSFSVKTSLWGVSFTKMYPKMQVTWSLKFPVFFMVSNSYRESLSSTIFFLGHKLVVNWYFFGPQNFYWSNRYALKFQPGSLRRLLGDSFCSSCHLVEIRGPCPAVHRRTWLGRHQLRFFLALFRPRFSPESGPQTKQKVLAARTEFSPAVFKSLSRSLWPR